MKSSYIYGIFNKINNKCLYIGQTKRNVQAREKEHIRDIKNGKHKINKLNTYNPEDLEVRELLELKTDNSFILFIAECCYNSIYKPLNKCVLQGFGGSVTVRRVDKDVAERLLDVIAEC